MARSTFFRPINPTYLWTTFFQPYPKLDLTEQPESPCNMPQSSRFEVTLHHDMLLDLPDRERLVSLKKVYFLMRALPEDERRRWCGSRLPRAAALHAAVPMHFTYYIFIVERMSIVQYLVHVKTFAINPLLRRRIPLQHTGEPYTPAAAG